MKDKVALVTGARRGIGRAIAQTLAAHNATIVVNDVDIDGAQNVAREINEDAGRAVALQADVSEWAQVKQMVKDVLAKFDKIDILVNNAGVLRPTKVEDITSEEWDLIMSVNVKGVFNCSKAVLEVMKTQRSGRIVNIASSAGRSVSDFGGVHYTTSKAAVIGLTRHLAKDAAPYGITVNEICPGTIDTEMVRDSCKPQYLQEVVSAIPLGRMGTPNDVANVVLFLASDLSSYVTGASLDVNGGALLI